MKHKTPNELADELHNANTPLAVKYQKMRMLAQQIEADKSESSGVKTLPTYQIKIYISGPIDVAKQIIREHVMERPLCVTIEPTTFIYTGGEEAGYVVGLLKYPRFPTAPNELNVRAAVLAELLLEKTFQRSALIVRPEDTTWITRETKP